MHEKAPPIGQDLYRLIGVGNHRAMHPTLLSPTYSDE